MANKKNGNSLDSSLVKAYLDALVALKEANAKVVTTNKAYGEASNEQYSAQMRVNQAHQALNNSAVVR